MKSFRSCLFLFVAVFGLLFAAMPVPAVTLTPVAHGDYRAPQRATHARGAPVTRIARKNVFEVCSSRR